MIKMTIRDYYYICDAPKNKLISQILSIRISNQQNNNMRPLSYSQCSQKSIHFLDFEDQKSIKVFSKSTSKGQNNSIRLPLYSHCSYVFIHVVISWFKPLKCFQDIFEKPIDDLSAIKMTMCPPICSQESSQITKYSVPIDKYPTLDKPMHNMIIF